MYSEIMFSPTISCFQRSGKVYLGIAKGIPTMKALIVEDSAAFREMTRNMLMARFPFMRISDAANAVEALRELARDCPDFILMDIRLPGKNGLELTREIKALYPRVAVIILTSYDFPEYREAAKRFGADYFLVKGTARTNEILSSIDSIVSPE
ncbi:MAG: response regulator [Candidatus Abyssobacteria bacterium SURF_5]|uniref:Response regulator n=1 Tax=Abyssobacteria bacterium (strain SURF_5) TaxID=2093360 RepID=A0A3A4NH98_ABYX5|nr:MAG: response regulator [Candidatus Abyssubacteria bacterium SURF_5]